MPVNYFCADSVLVFRKYLKCFTVKHQLCFSFNQNEEQVSKWKKGEGEGEKVARILSEKTLEETTSEMEGNTVS